VFQTAAPAKLSTSSVAASLLFHSIAILLLCLVAFLGPPAGLDVKRPLAKAILITPSLELPAREAFDSQPKPAAEIVFPYRQFSAPPRPTSEVLRVPALDPPRAAGLDLDRALTPSNGPVPLLSPPPLPARVLAPVLPLVLPSIPPVLPSIKTGAFAPLQPVAAAPTPPRDVKAAGFAAVPPQASLPSRRLTSTGGFETISARNTSGKETLPTGRPMRPTASGFGDATVAMPSAGPARRPPASPTVTLPAEILDKPKPTYTDEARRLNIEGEVLLDVIFEASGDTRILRVLHGLGHGLDESAIAAARQIHFRPAQRDGVAVDSSAAVHIQFQLAN